MALCTLILFSRFSITVKTKPSKPYSHHNNNKTTTKVTNYCANECVCMYVCFSDEIKKKKKKMVMVLIVNMSMLMMVMMMVMLR